MNRAFVEYWVDRITSATTATEARLLAEVACAKGAYTNRCGECERCEIMVARDIQVDMLEAVASRYTSSSSRAPVWGDNTPFTNMEEDPVAKKTGFVVYIPEEPRPRNKKNK